MPAAGVGRRMGSDIPKQYLRLGEKLILEHTLENLMACKPRNLVLVVDKDDVRWREIALSEQCLVVEGGATRAESVLCGLAALQVDRSDWVLVHDAVRPCITAADIEKLVETVVRDADAIGGLLALPVVDTLKQVDTHKRVVTTHDREIYWLAQTPQMFRHGLLVKALQQAAENNTSVTDESAAMEQLGYHPKIVQGSRRNIKITVPQDLIMAEAILKGDS